MPPIETPDWLLDSIGEEERRHRASPADQSAALEELFELFTTRRGRLPRRSYLDVPRTRLAYLRYHLPLNVARARLALRDLLAAAPRARDLRTVVDLGAGPGSASIAAICELGAGARDYVLTDRSRPALRLAQRFLERAPSTSDPAGSAGGSRVRVEHLKLPRLPRLPRATGPALVLLAMVLNELEPDPRHGLDAGAFLQTLHAGIPRGSLVLAVEPALRLPSRRLLELHDAALRSGAWRVLAPCTHQRECPLLRARGRPWCHFHFGWRAGKIVEEIARPLGLSCEQGSLSYLAIERRSRGDDRPARAPAPPRDPTARAIGDPMRVQGGGTGIYVCREGRRETLRRPPRETSRGDVLEGGDGRRPARIVRAWPARRPR